MRRAGSVAVSETYPAALAEVRPGSHICAFYKTENDLLDLVLPFFSAGVSTVICASG
jgi:hypothetical protein